MRGNYSRPGLGVFASLRLFNSSVILSACFIAFAGALSGCASVSAGNSAADPAPAKISVVPSIIDFKAVVVGQKNSQTVKVTNSSSNYVNLKSLRVSGTGFSVTSAKAPVILAPGGNLSLSVVFAPAVAAEETGSLIITSADLKAPVSVPLSGSGDKATPALAISPTSVNFGTRALKSSTSQSVVLTNTGNIALSISSISVANPAFSVSGISNGVLLSPNQKLEFQVWFHPTAAGKASVTIALDSSAGLAPLKLAVAGSASNSTVSAPAAAIPHSVTLNWSDRSSFTKGYHVYRGQVSGGPFERINQGLIETTFYKDTDVVAGGHYFYAVTAVGEGGPESSYSNEVAVDIPND
jgi:P pilus assembly chaperone PapD